MVQHHLAAELHTRCENKRFQGGKYDRKATKNINNVIFIHYFSIL